MAQEVRHAGCYLDIAISTWSRIVQAVRKSVRPGASMELYSLPAFTGTGGLKYTISSVAGAV